MTTTPLHQYANYYFGWFMTRYPRLGRWLTERFTTDTFRGLPLTGLVGLLVVKMMVLSEVAENLVNSEPMGKVGQPVTQWLYDDHTPIIGRLVYGLTWLGSG